MNFTTVTALFFTLMASASECMGQKQFSVEAASASTRTMAVATPFDPTINLGMLQDDPETPLQPADEWRFDFNTWMWLMGVTGDIGARDLTTDVSANFGDILDASDSLFAFSGRLEISKGDWGGYIEGMYSRIGIDGVSGPLGFADVDVTYEQTLLDFGIMYRIGDWQPEGNAAEHRLNTTLDLYVGGRYTNLELKLEPAMAATRSGSIDWVDPIVGAKLVLPFSESWHLRANSDIGGFGVESDFTWSVTGVVGYDFHLFDLPATVYLGYRALGQDYSEGSGADKFTWDVIQHGPLLGFSLRF